MARGILSNAPVWVWPLLLGLIWLGWRSSKDRQVPVWLVYALPLVGGMSLRMVLGLGGGSWLWLGFTSSYAIGVIAGYGVQGALILGKDNGRVNLRGEWLSLIVFVLIFLLNFVVGTLKALPGNLAGGFELRLVFVAISGLSAGMFLGRAFRVWVYVQQGKPV